MIFKSVTYRVRYTADTELYSRSVRDEFSYVFCDLHVSLVGFGCDDAVVFRILFNKRVYPVHWDEYIRMAENLRYIFIYLSYHFLSEHP